MARGGGHFKRIIRNVKRCLRIVLGNYVGRNVDVGKMLGHLTRALRCYSFLTHREMSQRGGGLLGNFANAFCSPFNPPFHNLLTDNRIHKTYRIVLSMSLILLIHAVRC